MSIVRIGLSETKNFAEGYDSIFGKKTTEKDKKQEVSETASKDKKKPAKKSRKK